MQIGHKNNAHKPGPKRWIATRCVWRRPISILNDLRLRNKLGLRPIKAQQPKTQHQTGHRHWVGVHSSSGESKYTYRSIKHTTHTLIHYLSHRSYTKSSSRLLIEYLDTLHCYCNSVCRPVRRQAFREIVFEQLRVVALSNVRMTPTSTCESTTLQRASNCGGTSHLLDTPNERNLTGGQF